MLNESIFNIKYFEPWWDSMDFPGLGESFINELIRELNPNHELFGRKLKILAKGQDNDDILVEMENNQLSVVHLT